MLCVQCFQQNDSIGVGVGANNLLLNGGFENTNCPFNNSGTTYCPNSSMAHCTIANWACTGGGSMTYCYFWDSTIYKVVEGSHAAYFGNSYCTACSAAANDTACINNTGCTVTGIPAGYPISGANYGTTTGVSLSQTASGLIIGDVYVLEFWAGGEADQPKNGLFAVDIGFGNVFLRNKSTGAHTGIGTRYLIQFKATATSHAIKFTNWGHISIYNTELILDDVRLYTEAHLPPTVTLCSHDGINELNENEINIYPNPISNELTVNTANNEPSAIIIYDMLSRKLIQQTFSNTLIINTEFLSKGIYLYEIINKKGSVKGKVVKE